MKSPLDWLKIGLLVGVGIGLGIFLVQFLWPFAFLLTVIFGVFLVIMATMGFLARLIGSAHADFKLMRGWRKRQRR